MWSFLLISEVMLSPGWRRIILLTMATVGTVAIVAMPIILSMEIPY